MGLSRFCAFAILNAGAYPSGGAYGHRWFVDVACGLPVVALTNTAFGGRSGAFPDEIRKAAYG
jgi:hypothetical protein